MMPRWTRNNLILLKLWRHLLILLLPLLTKLRAKSVIWKLSLIWGAHLVLRVLVLVLLPRNYLKPVAFGHTCGPWLHRLKLTSLKIGSICRGLLIIITPLLHGSICILWCSIHESHYCLLTIPAMRHNLRAWLTRCHILTAILSHSGELSRKRLLALQGGFCGQIWRIHRYLIHLIRWQSNFSFKLTNWISNDNWWIWFQKFEIL